MIRITVYQTNIRELSGISEKSGKPRPYHMRFQNAYAHTVDRDGNSPPVPEKFEITLEDGQSAYPVGEYTLQPSALYVGRDGRLACTPRLTPAKAATPAPAPR
jgi:hypothetical protein